MTKVGVIALQGSVEEHYSRLCDLVGEDSVYQVNKTGKIPFLDKLVIPGGESTTLLRLMWRNGLAEEVKNEADDSLDVFGTCAGLIALAKEGGNDVHSSDQDLLDLMDIEVTRNAFGRQKESFQVPLDLEFLDSPFPSVFIRAPAIVDFGDSVRVLGEFRDKVVAARQGNFLVTSFHPELVDDTRVYEYFLKMN